MDNKPQVQPIFLAVSNESAKLAWISMVMDGNKEPLVELESAGELLHNLPDTLQELCEHRRRLLDIHTVQQPTAVSELVSKR